MLIIFFQITKNIIDNCGSLLETDKGWIVLTHGVGPMRQYCISAILLDIENRVIYDQWSYTAFFFCIPTAPPVWLYTKVLEANQEYER